MRFCMQSPTCFSNWTRILTCQNSRCRVLYARKHRLPVWDGNQTLDSVVKTQHFHDESRCRHAPKEVRKTPVRLLVVLERTKHVKERLVKAFWHSITHGMVRSSPCLIQTGNGTQLLNNLTLKVTTLVTMEARGEAIMTNDVIKQESGCGLGCLDSGWNGLSVPCKMVRNDQHVLVTTSGHLPCPVSTLMICFIM